MSSRADHTERSVINAQGAGPFNRITVPFTCEEHVAGREFRSEVGESSSRIIRLRWTCLVAKMAKGPRRIFTQFKAVLQPAIPSRALADFRIYASYRGVPGQFYGTLKVVRLTDKRGLVPLRKVPGNWPIRPAAYGLLDVSARIRVKKQDF